MSVALLLALLVAVVWWATHKHNRDQALAQARAAQAVQAKKDERELALEGSESVVFREGPGETDNFTEWTYDFPAMRAVGGWEASYEPHGSQTEYLLRRTSSGEWLLKAVRYRQYGIESGKMSAGEAPWEPAENNVGVGRLHAYELDWHPVLDEHLGQVESGYQLYLRIHAQT